MFIANVGEECGVFPQERVLFFAIAHTDWQRIHATFYPQAFITAKLSGRRNAPLPRPGRFPEPAYANFQVTPRYDELPSAGRISDYSRETRQGQAIHLGVK